MPILEVHLVEGEHAAAQVAALLERMSTRYAEVLESPLERIRAYVTLHRPEQWTTGGVAGVEAPYFTAIVLEGRSAEQRRRLLGAFTDIIVDTLGVDRLVIATDVDHAMIGFGTPGQRPLDNVSVAELRDLAAQGEFASGSMGPKVEAVCRFVEQSGKSAVITSLNNIVDGVTGKSGTIVSPSSRS